MSETLGDLRNLSGLATLLPIRYVAPNLRVIKADHQIGVTRWLIHAQWTYHAVPLGGEPTHRGYARRGLHSLPGIDDLSTKPAATCFTHLTRDRYFSRLQAAGLNAAGPDSFSEAAKIRPAYEWELL